MKKDSSNFRETEKNKKKRKKKDPEGKKAILNLIIVHKLTQKFFL